MRKYEMVFIVHPDVEGDDVTAIVESVKELVTRNDGQVEALDDWSRRRLAYPIQDVNEGQYMLLRFAMEPDGIAELELNLILNEQILRHLVVHLEE